jgi:maltooligosyltrehalose trehalohydrolase
MSTFQPTLGATYVGWGTVFKVWSPDAMAVDVILDSKNGDSKNGDPETHRMTKSNSGYHSVTLPHVTAGALYAYRVDSAGPYPDPASRYQPEGVHGRSQVVDPAAFVWSDQDWKGLELEDTVIYELHVGTFTEGGTFQAAREKLPLLKELGVTAIGLMPLADFAGNRNWGYDGVAPFATARCYGTPDDLRLLVNDAHGLGLAMHLDVVYNHFGPDGAYQGAFSPHYFSPAHRSPWGDGINFDGPYSEPVRDYFIENALRWVHEYHIDGLRLDATHAITDDSARHVLASIASAVHASVEGTGRNVLVIAEDERNLARVILPESRGGWGLDGVWSDDFHHQMRRVLAGDSDGYFQDFDGSAESIAITARKGWFYTGQFAPYFGGPRGTDPSGIPLRRFVFCLQNHDQVGNRAMGDRLHHVINPAAYRAASVLLLLLPETPLLFMGQEWAASTPFQYFTDHNAELGELVRKGRRQEFQHFAAFADPLLRGSIPDPQDIRTFAASRLDWTERDSGAFASTLQLYKMLLHLRKAIRRDTPFEIHAYDADTLVIERGFIVVIRLRGAGPVDLSGRFSSRLGDLILSTEDPRYATDASPIVYQPDVIRFGRPGALVFAPKAV